MNRVTLPRRYTVVRVYYQAVVPVAPDQVPPWLLDKIAAAIPNLHPSRTITLSVGDTPLGSLVYGDRAVTNPSYRVTVYPVAVPEAQV
jgi:hypothetical protein